MARDEEPVRSEKAAPGGREPITPVKRKRLQKIFEHASKQMTQENYDYATELFAQCVLDDPANKIYVQSYIGNLKKKYDNNRTGSKLAKLKERGARSGMKKALGQGNWDAVIKHGLKVLTVNPWDVSALTAMATAAENSGDDDCELFYLKCALEAKPKDPDVNRQCAVTLTERHQFDQAIACWHRVELARPDDDEARRAIAALAVEKTISRGGYEEKDESKKMAAISADQPQQAVQQPQQSRLKPEDKLEQKIAEDPSDMSAYHELAQIHIEKENYKAAESVYARAMKASGGDADIRERQEDVQLRHLRQQIARTSDEETQKKLRKELLEKEVAVYKNRCERYPNNLVFKYDLGLRYQYIGDYNEAIKLFQVARNDPRRKGHCMLALGQCFEKIKQYRLAMTHYEEAVEQIPDREGEHKKAALYRAGRLALAMKNLDTSEKHLTTLAGIDFGYKDVSQLLDKLAEMRDND